MKSANNLELFEVYLNGDAPAGLGQEYLTKITLRDLFAGFALVGLAHRQGYNSAADDAYAYAAAMLAARERQP